jgi:hypothetical protein
VIADTPENRRRARELSVDVGMLLPPGKTCGDCRHYERCRFLVGRSLTEQHCDWYPSRFQEKPQ